MIKIKNLDSWEDGEILLEINGKEVTLFNQEEIEIMDGPKKLEVKHMDFGEDDKDYDQKMMEALNK